MNMSTPMSPVEQVQEQILQLEAAVLSQNPLMPTLLKTIRDKLRADSDIVTLLSEEDIHRIVAALEVQTGEKITTAKEKSVTSKAAKGSLQIGVDL